MATKSPTQFHNHWGAYANQAALPGVGAAQDGLEAGDQAYSIADGQTFTCTNPSFPAAWAGGGGGAPSGWQADFVDSYLYTTAVVAIEEVIGQGGFDGSRVGTGGVYFFGMMTPVFAGVGLAEMRLYDIGPIAGPPTPLVLITSLQTAVSGGPQYEEQALAVGATPGPNQIADTRRMYEVRAFVTGAPGDTLFIGGGGMDVR